MKMPSNIKKFCVKITANLFNLLVYILKNRLILNLSREEIRAFKFSFSQFGEDLAILRCVDELKIAKGTYLDIGCFHPINLSNTLLLYKSGWRGINIDMNPSKVEAFLKHRSDDVNICCAISSSNGKFVISNKGRTTESLVPYDSNIKYDNDEIVVARTIDEVIKSTHFDSIDYVNIDCEGHDFEVLKMLNLEMYSVKIITIEALDKTSEMLISNYMLERGYTLSDKLHWTLLFIKK